MQFLKRVHLKTTWLVYTRNRNIINIFFFCQIKNKKNDNVLVLGPCNDPRPYRRDKIDYFVKTLKKKKKPILSIKPLLIFKTVGDRAR